MVWLYVRGADNRAVAGKEATRVLIATKQIPKGTTGAAINKGGYAHLVTMPKSSVPEGALDAIGQNLEVLSMNADIAPQQLLLEGMFEQPAVLSGGLNIPEGKVAVSVPVITTAGTGYVAPGSTLAIFDTFTVWGGAAGVPDGATRPDVPNLPAGDDLNREYAKLHATRLVLAKAEVVAVGIPGQAGAETNSQTSGTDVVSKEGDKSSSSAAQVATVSVITFALTQNEAERLIHAAQTGRLYIAVVNDSSDIKPGPGVDYDSMFN